MITLIDNYDSFTYNLYHYLSSREKVVIIKNDQVSKNFNTIIKSKGIVISPGPSTPFNSGVEPDLALRDAQNRLASGGGLLEKGGGFFGLKKDKNKDQVSSAVVMPVNVFLWKGALETVDFMPLSSTDPVGGTIITDWYSTGENQNERCKLNIFISGKKLNAENLKVTSFCQEFKNQIWVNKKISKENNTKIENAILNKAKKLRLQSS